MVSGRATLSARPESRGQDAVIVAARLRAGQTPICARASATRRIGRGRSLCPRKSSAPSPICAPFWRLTAICPKPAPPWSRGLRLPFHQCANIPRAERIRRRCPEPLPQIKARPRRPMRQMRPPCRIESPAALAAQIVQTGRSSLPKRRFFCKLSQRQRRACGCSKYLKFKVNMTVCTGMLLYTHPACRHGAPLR